MQINWRRGLVVSLSLSVMAALALVVITFKPETIENLGLIEPRFLVLALSMMIVAIAIEGRRISLVANSMGGCIGWLQGCAIYLSVSFASLTTPMGMGEIPALTYCYTQGGLKLGVAAAAAIVRSFVTKLVFLAGIVWLFGIVRGRVQFGPVTGDLFTVVALVFALTTVINACYVLFPNLLRSLLAVLPKGWLGGRLGRWQQRLDIEAKEFDKGLKILWNKGPMLLIRISLLSVLFWGVWFSLLPVLARGLNIIVDPEVLISRQFTLTLALPFIPMPGASGALELAMAAMYQGIVPRSLLGVFILCWRMLTYYLFLLAGSLAALGTLWRRRQE